jgi:hypothetical protein
MLSDDFIQSLDRKRLEPEMLPDGRLNTYALACCLCETINQGIVPASVAAFQRIVEEDAEFVDELNEYYRDDRKGQVVDLGLDTRERDILMEIVALRFAGRNWPINMDGPGTMREFAGRMDAALKAEGWDFRIRWEPLGGQPTP